MTVAIPKTAVRVWLEGEWAYVHLPAITGKTSHTIRFPTTVPGITALLRTLQARNEHSTLAQKGDPTQQQTDRLVEAYRKNGGRIERTRKKYSPKILDSAEAILKARGLI